MRGQNTMIASASVAVPSAAGVMLPT